MIALIGGAAAGTAWGWLLARPLVAGGLTLALFAAEALVLAGAGAAVAVAAGGAAGAAIRFGLVR